MNFYDMIKQFKNIQESMEAIKEDLRQRKEIIEREGVEIVYNGLGEITDINITEESLLGDWKRLKPLLIDLINEVQKDSREMMKEEFSKKFGGLLGGMGLGI